MRQIRRSARSFLHLPVAACRDAERRTTKRVGRLATVLATALVSACGGDVRGNPANHSDAGRPTAVDAGAHRPHGGVFSHDGGGDASASGEDGAVEDARASSDAALRDASVDGAPTADASPPDAGNCSNTGTLAIAGDYVAAGGTEHWLRQTATATTYAVVPGGVPTPTSLPKLFRVRLFCDHWLSLEGTGGDAVRLDWTTLSGALSICVRSVTIANAATSLSTPDANDAGAGCNGAPWLALTREAP